MVIAPMEAFATFDADAHLNRLMPKAVIQLGNADFRIYWETFCLAFRNLVRGAQFAKQHVAQLTEERTKLVRERFDYDFGAMKAGSTALIFILTENHDHNKVYLEVLEGLTSATPIADLTTWSLAYGHYLHLNCLQTLKKKSRTEASSADLVIEVPSVS